MQTKEYSKTDVENMPLGRLVLAIKGSKYWGNENRDQQLRDEIAIIINKIVENGLIYCHLLRLVIVSCDLPNEIPRWQRQLGEPEVITSNSKEETAGKTFLWGNGSPEATYGVIILPESLAFALVEVHDELNFRNRAKCIFIHELAHVHNMFFLLRALGPFTFPMNNDWHGIRNAIARTIYDEFLSELIASIYLENYSIDDETLNTGNFVSGCLKRIELSISEYFKDGNILTMWNYSSAEMSSLFNHIARAIGFLFSLEDYDSSSAEKFYKEINNISPGWGGIVCHLISEIILLSEKQTWQPGILQGLEDIVEKGFHVVGLYPKYDNQGLKVDVRY